MSIQLEVENARLLLEQARANRAQAARDLWVAQTRVELLPSLPLGSAPTASMTATTTVPPATQMTAPQTQGGFTQPGGFTQQ